MSNDVSDKITYLHEHLHYEIQMLRFTHDALKTPNSRPMANALMESFVIHARNLMDFFYNQFDDKCFCAADFVVPGSIANKSPFGPAGKAYGLAHNQTLHLGQRRPTEDKDKIGPDHRQLLRDAIETKIPPFEQALLPQFALAWQEGKRKAAQAQSINVLGPANATGTFSYQSFGTTGPDDPNRNKKK